MPQKKQVLRIEKIDILSAAKISGIVGLFVGIIIGVVYGIIFGFVIHWLAGLALLIGIPLLYGIGLFLSSALFIWFHNVATKKIGGIKVTYRIER